MVAVKCGGRGGGFMSAGLRRPRKRSEMHLSDKDENAYEVLTRIEELTMHEGDSVTIYFPNPDFDGDDYAIGVDKDFGEKTIIYTGNTLLECLKKAEK